MHIDSAPIAMDMTSSFSTITSGRPAAGTGDRAENWAQFDNISCDKSNTDEWNNSTPDVDNHLNRYPLSLPSRVGFNRFLIGRMF